MELVCSICGAINEVTLVKQYRSNRGKYPGDRVYLNSRGQKQINNLCYECRSVKARIRRGSSTRDESKKPRVVKAVRAEWIVAEHYEKLGYAVKRTTQTGPDLVCIRADETITVEVKSAQKLHTCNSWFAPAVTAMRKNDDFCAIVLPDERIHIEPMAAHLSKCGKSGSRIITKLIRGKV